MVQQSTVAGPEQPTSQAPKSEGLVVVLDGVYEVEGLDAYSPIGVYTLPGPTLEPLIKLCMTILLVCAWSTACEAIDTLCCCCCC
jgi:hypothetical protein